MQNNYFIWKIAGLYQGLQPNYFGPLIITPTDIYFISMEPVWNKFPNLHTMVAKGISVSQQIKTEKKVSEKIDATGINVDRLDQMINEYDNSIKINKQEILNCKAKGFSYRLFTIKTDNKSYTFDLLEKYKNNIMGNKKDKEETRKKINKDFFEFLHFNNYPFKTNWWGV